jgi:hypothetical protein
VFRVGEVARGCGELREFRLRSVAEKTETLKRVHYSVRARPCSNKRKLNQRERGTKAWPVYCYEQRKS